MKNITRISKLRPINSSVQFYAASSGDSYRHYANIMFDAVFSKIDEIVDKINEIIDYLNEQQR